MRIKKTIQSIILQFFLIVIFTVPTVPMAMSEMTLNDNVNIGGDIFLEGDGCGINFPDGSYQTTGAITPWNQKISERRFVLVLDDEAVFDRETGLVWQRDTADDTGCNWDAAQNVCYELEIGGRMGWRLPTIDELATLIDRTQSNPALPEGHFFTNVRGFYWSSTDYVGVSGAFRVELEQGIVHGCPATIDNYVRAVRSGR